MQEQHSFPAVHAVRAVGRSDMESRGTSTGKGMRNLQFPKQLDKSTLHMRLQHVLAIRPSGVQARTFEGRILPAELRQIRLRGIAANGQGGVSVPTM